MENRDEPILTGAGEERNNSHMHNRIASCLLFRRWFVLFFWDNVDAHPSTRQLASRHHPKRRRRRRRDTKTLNHFSF